MFLVCLIKQLLPSTITGLTVPFATTSRNDTGNSREAQTLDNPVAQRGRLVQSKDLLCKLACMSR